MAKHPAGTHTLRMLRALAIAVRRLCLLTTVAYTLAAVPGFLFATFLDPSRLS